MSRRMLIDGVHPEETRVVVTSGNQLEEYDIETSTRTQLKGNIYLAKVTRVEPSLQAAFVEFGGNRHGFLAFSEIHPDYYQIPIEDREALKADQAGLEGKAVAAQAHLDEIDGAVDDDANENAEAEAEGGDERSAEPATGEDGAGSATDEDGAGSATDEDGAGEAKAEAGSGAESDEKESDEKETTGGRRGHRRRSALRRYSIQEVIRRRQILLVQVVKEERGNKGAALTTYLSLAGRYCVLMPNAARGGGISRKITNAADRKRLKELLNDLKLAEGMGVIMRTAGMERNKSEIKRDFDYLMRAWEDVRELTLKSTAPTLVYEEGNLIKRAIRDLYSRDIDEVWIEGDDAYQDAKNFMRLMMPSHAKRVQPYREEAIPLFHRFQVENQIEAMHDPSVRLKSGGYIVINMTEALVAVDVNSGRSTRERNIEETALKTNLEAAAEIARQLRLRDMAGLIVIDFIDMEENRNQRAVEKRMKEATKTDRARIQLGRISAFGLFEMSRQRLRPSLIEASTDNCPHCRGSGRIRSVESASIQVLRAIEEEGIRKRSSEVSIAVPVGIAFYILNQKRAILAKIEDRYGFRVTVSGDESLIPPDMRLERVKAKASPADDEAGEAPAAEIAAEPQADEGAKEPPRRKRTRRRRKKTDGEAAPDTAEDAAAPEAVEVEAEAEATPPTQEESAGDADADKPAAKRRRRGKRGGRRRNRGQKSTDEAIAAEGAPTAEAKNGEAGEAGMAAETAEADESDAGDAAVSAPEPEATEAGATVEPQDESSGNGEALPDEPVSDIPAEVIAEPEAPEPEATEAGATVEPQDESSGNGEALPDEPASDIPAEVIAEPEAPERRRGWWQR